MPVATEQAPGAIRLSGDLGGTAQAPTVPGLAGKADSVHTHDVGSIDGLGDELAEVRAVAETRAVVKRVTSPPDSPEPGVLYVIPE